MKSMQDYVELEPQFYQSVFENREELFKDFVDRAVQIDYKSVVIYATGSSSNAAFGARPFISKCLNVPVYVEEPSFNATYMLRPQKETLYIAISQGGHSYSTKHMIERLQADDMNVFVMTTDLNSPIGKIAKNHVDMGMPIEEMPYVTAGYSITILDLMLMALQLGAAKSSLSATEVSAYLDEIKTVLANLEEVVLRSKRWVERVKNKYLQANRMIFIGYGAAYGVAREGETKITETVRITAFGKELEEYMHGPYLGMHPTDSVIFIEPDGQLQERAIKLKHFLDRHGVDVTVISANGDDKRVIGKLGFNLNVDELLTPLFMTIPIHLLAFKLSALRENDLTQSAYPDFDEITGSKI